MGQLNRKIRLRTRLMETFPDGRSAPIFVAASLKYVAESKWGSRRHPNVMLWGDGRTGNRPVVLSESAQESRRYPQQGPSGHHAMQEDRLSTSTRWAHPCKRTALNGRHGQQYRVGYTPCSRYLASVASLAGRHQASLSRYHSMVSARPASKSVCVGPQPSSVLSLVGSIA